VADASFAVRAMELGHWAASSVDRPWLDTPDELPTDDGLPQIVLAEE